MSEETREAVELPSSTTGAVFDVRTITYVAVTVAMSAVLFLIKPLAMPYGGSISLNMLPILFLSLYAGVRPGLIAGVLYGLVNYIQAPYLVHPAQMILDYPLAFGLVGLAGLFGTGSSVKIGAGVILAGLLRFSAHFVSGVLFLHLFIPDAAERSALGDPLIYSAGYNASYMVPSTIIALPLVYILLRVMTNEGTRTSD